MKKLVLLSIALVAVMALTSTAYAGTIGLSADWWLPVVSGAEELMCQLHIGQYDEFDEWAYDFNENIYITPAAANSYVIGLSVPIASNAAIRCTYWSVAAGGTREVVLAEDEYDSWYEGWEWDPDQYVWHVNMWGYNDWCSASEGTYTVTGSSSVAATVFDTVVESQLCASDSTSVTGSLGVRYASWNAEAQVSDLWDEDGTDYDWWDDVGAAASATFWGPAAGIAGKATFGSLSLEAAGQLAVLRGNVSETGVEGWGYDGEDYPTDEELDRSYWTTVPTLDAVLRIGWAVTPQIELAVGYRSSTWFGAPLAPQFSASWWEWRDVQRRSDVSFSGYTFGATVRF